MPCAPKRSQSLATWIRSGLLPPREVRSVVILLMLTDKRVMMISDFECSISNFIFPARVLPDGGKYHYSSPNISNNFTDSLIFDAEMKNLLRPLLITVFVLAVVPVCRAQQNFLDIKNYHVYYGWAHNYPQDWLIL